MGKLTFEVFVSVIESIRLQLHQDTEYANNIAATFKIDEGAVYVYDNNLLIKSLVKLLQVHFPKKDSFCEIEHFMFDMNFGKAGGDAELITIEDLWYQLNKEPMVSTHPLIDDHYGSYSGGLTPNAIANSTKEDFNSKHLLSESIPSGFKPKLRGLTINPTVADVISFAEVEIKIANTVIENANVKDTAKNLICARILAFEEIITKFK